MTKKTICDKCLLEIKEKNFMIVVYGVDQELSRMDFCKFCLEDFHNWRNSIKQSMK